MLNYGQYVQYCGDDDETNLYRPFIPELSVPMAKHCNP